MATRLYLSNAAPDYTPATKRGTWSAPAATLARKLGAKAGAAATAPYTNPSYSGGSMLHGRWISDPFLSGGSLAGTVSWVHGAVSTNPPNQLPYTRVYVYVTSGDTDTPRGPLLANYVGTDVFPYNTAGAVAMTNIALTSVTAQAGDRLVLELGHNISGATQSLGCSINYGATGATDLVDGSAAVTANPGWFEFSALDPFFTASAAAPTNRFFHVCAGD